MRIDWIKANAGHSDKDACLMWPFPHKSRPNIKWGGVGQTAARVMCTLAHGQAPTPEHQAAHSCAQGVQGCVNPNHLRWATHLENMEDRELHGNTARGVRNRGGGKLTESKVMAIREFSHTVGPVALADLFGVSRELIWKIQTRRLWSHV